MQFNEYLKSCRENISLTQEQLAQDLYIFDTECFTSIDSNTLSKWERNIVKPQISKQVLILQYFQEQTHSALPCFDTYNVQEAEEIICKRGMKNLLGNSKELVLNFPSESMQADDLHIYSLRNSENLEKILDINLGLDKDFNHDTTGFHAEQFKAWALHPSSSFFACEYQSQFFGLLFTLRLKPEVFERIMDLKMEERDLSVDDFASFEEIGCNYIISFFAMNEKAASLLFIRYYAHLIANQKVIAEVGLATMMKDAKQLIANMNLLYHGSKSIGKDLEMQTYRETLANFLASEKVIKMILSKQDCPEE